MKHKKFWTTDKYGNEVLRDLAEEHKDFTLEKYSQGLFDAHNFVWYENFELYMHESNGCDYERLGCKIKEGDVVLDLGANIGVFAHRAETRGASRVLCFEPITPTFSCLMKNKGEKTEVFKLGVGDSNKFEEFNIHTDYTHIGGGFKTKTHFEFNREIIHKEHAYIININDIFENNISDRIDFIKMDIEGSEVAVLNALKDEHLSKIRCFAAEFHNIFPDFRNFQDSFVNRMRNLNFREYTLYHGHNDETLLRTLTLWKDEEN